MAVLRAGREAIRRLAWHVVTGMALAGACMPGGQAAYESVLRVRREGPGRSRASVREEAQDGIAAIERFLAERAPRDDHQSR